MMQSGTQSISQLEGQSDWLNWPLLILIALVPLQNIYLGKIPSLGGGLNILNILMLVAFMTASSRRETSYANPFNKYIMLFGGSYLFSWIVAISVMGWDENVLTTMKDMFFAYLFFFVTYKSITGKMAMKAVFWATVVPLTYMFKVFHANLSIMGTSTYKDQLRFNNGTFMSLGSNELAAFYATYTFILIGLALVEKNRRNKWILFACIAMNLYSLLYSFSRGAYLSVMIGIVVFCWFNRKIKLISIVLTLVFGLLISGVDIFPKAVTERFNSAFVEEENLEESAKSRIILWSIAMDKFKSSPLVGVGYGNFKKMNEFGLDTHNYYVKLLVEGGVVSFLSFIPIIFVSMRNGLKLLRKSDDELEKKLAIGFLACLASLVVGNYFGDRFTHYPLISYFYVYLAMLMKTLDWRNNDNQQENHSPAFN